MLNLIMHPWTCPISLELLEIHSTVIQLHMIFQCDFLKYFLIRSTPPYFPYNSKMYPASFILISSSHSISIFPGIHSLSKHYFISQNFSFDFSLGLLMSLDTAVALDFVCFKHISILSFNLSWQFYMPNSSMWITSISSFKKT